jgi:NTE family protein
MVAVDDDLAGQPGLGLVLSSGAARGAAHAGVLLALTELGIRPGVVVGTSSGALIGSAWAAGIGADRIVDRVLDATWADFGRPYLIGNGPALLDTTALRANLDEVFAHRRLEDLPVRFGAVATDLRARRAALLDSGDAATAVQASLAVPGVFPPVRLGDRLLVDGVLTSPLPVWAAHELGATRTIAVRLRPEAPAGRSAGLRGAVLPRAVDVAPDVDIVVDTTRYSSWSPRDVPRLVELGYRVTRDALCRLGARPAEPIGPERAAG